MTGDAHRLRAPSSNGALLAEPPLSAAAELLQSNRAQLAEWRHDFQGRRADVLRTMAKRQVWEAAKTYHGQLGLDWADAEFASAPWVVTGHQPELFHPGVWIKNFAIADVARRVSGIGLNLIVDNDTPKSSAIRVPSKTASGLRALPVQFDAAGGEAPYEDWVLKDPSEFRTFPDRVRAAMVRGVADPILDSFWPLALRAGDATNRVGLRFAAARRGIEAAVGVRNAETPLSGVCQTDAFLWFACHLLAHLPRYLSIHNGALARYRRQYHIRSRHHPVPVLVREGEWLEAPFWVWRASRPRRRPLLARQLAATMELKVQGEPSPFLEIPLGPDREACCAVDRLRELASMGVRLRTRALTTTMFARLLLGDLFVHGIGGAKYDELGDAIIREFFDFEPPPFATLSMTVWLGLSDDAQATPSVLREVNRRIRDLDFNPERQLTRPLAPDVEALVASKRRLVEGPCETHRQRAERFHELRRITEALRETVIPLRLARVAERDRLVEGLRHNRVARSREYPFVLHSRQTLPEVLLNAVKADEEKNRRGGI